MQNTVAQEIEFKKRIDCNFPYSDMQTCTNLINESASISHEAMFAVLHEICRAPRGRTTPATQFKLADLWLSKATHPISNEICDVAKTMINGEEIPVDQTIIVLDSVAKYGLLGSALNIVYFSCDDTNGKMERHYNMIVERRRASTN